MQLAGHLGATQADDLVRRRGEEQRHGWWQSLSLDDDPPAFWGQRC